MTFSKLIKSNKGNILPNKEDNIPCDLYSEVLKDINKKIDNLIANNPLYINLKNIILDRKIVVRSIMTIPYNVTVNGVVSHLSEFF